MNKKLSILVATVVLSLLAMSSVSAFVNDPAAADTTVPYLEPQVHSTVGATNPQELINDIARAIGWVQVFFWVLAVIMGVYAAFLYLTSSGDPGRVSRANSTLLYTAIAVAVAVFAYALPSVVAFFVGG